MIELTANTSVSARFSLQTIEQTPDEGPTSNDESKEGAEFLSVLYQTLVPLTVPLLPAKSLGDVEVNSGADETRLPISSQPDSAHSLEKWHSTATASTPILLSGKGLSARGEMVLTSTPVLPQLQTLAADEAVGRLPLTQINQKNTESEPTTKLSTTPSPQRDIVNWNSHRQSTYESNPAQAEPIRLEDMQTSDHPVQTLPAYDQLDLKVAVKEQMSVSSVPILALTKQQNQVVNADELMDESIPPSIHNRITGLRPDQTDGKALNDAASSDKANVQARPAAQRPFAEETTFRNLREAVAADSNTKTIVSEVTPDDFTMIDWNAGKTDKLTGLTRSNETQSALQAVADKFVNLMYVGKQVPQLNDEQVVSNERNFKKESKGEQKAAAQAESADVIEWPIQQAGRVSHARAQDQKPDAEVMHEGTQDSSILSPQTQTEGEETQVENAASQPKSVSETNQSSPNRPVAKASVEVADVVNQMRPERAATVRAEGKVNVQHPVIPEDFARNLIVKISDELRAHIEGRSSEVRVVMKPESLGELSLRVSLENGKLAATMDISQHAVRTAMEAQLPQLREALASHGIDIQRFDIVSTGETLSQQSKGGQASHKHTRLKKHGLVEVEENIEPVKYLGYNTVEYII